MKPEITIPIRPRTLLALTGLVSDGELRPALKHIHIEAPGPDGLSRICATDGRLFMLTHVKPDPEPGADFMPFPVNGMLLPTDLVPPLSVSDRTSGIESDLRIVYHTARIGIEKDGRRTTVDMPRGDDFPKGAAKTFRKYLDDDQSKPVSDADFSAIYGATLWMAAETFAPLSNEHPRTKLMLREAEEPGGGPFQRLRIKLPGLPAAYFVQMGLRPLPR